MLTLLFLQGQGSQAQLSQTLGSFSLSSSGAVTVNASLSEIADSFTVSPPSSSDLPVGFAAASRYRAAQFTASLSYTAIFASIRLKSFGSNFSYSIIASIWSDNSGVPGTQIGPSSSAISVSSLPFSYGSFQTFVGLSASLTQGTKYWLVIRESGGPENGISYVTWEGSTPSSTTNFTSSNASSWTSHTGAMGYKIGAALNQLSPFTISSSGTVNVQGSLSQTLGAFTISSAGTVSIHASLSQTLGAFTVSAAGTVKVQASLSQTLGSFSISSAGQVKIAAALSKTLGAFTESGQSHDPISASLSTTLGNFSISSSAAVTSHGSLSQTLGAFSISSDGHNANTIQPVIVVELPAGGGGFWERVLAIHEKRKKRKGKAKVALGQFSISSKARTRNKARANITLSPFCGRAIATNPIPAMASGRSPVILCNARARAKPIPPKPKPRRAFSREEQDIEAILLLDVL